MTHRHLLAAFIILAISVGCASEESAQVEASNPEQISAVAPPEPPQPPAAPNAISTEDASTDVVNEPPPMTNDDSPPEPPSPPAQPAPPTPASRPAPTAALGPGHVRVKGSVVDAETKGLSHICTIKISQVHGYGSSTKPLAAGNEIRISVKAVQIAAAASKGKALLKNGNSVELTIKYQKPPAISPTPPSWQLSEIH